MKMCEVLNIANPVSESIGKDFFHKSVENGKFMQHEKGGLNDPAILYLHDLDNDTEEGNPMLVTFADQADAEEAQKQYGGKIIRSGMGTFRIIKDSDNLDETTSAGSVATSMGGGNGFVNGGPGTLSRAPGSKKPKKKKNKNKE